MGWVPGRQAIRRQRELGRGIKTIPLPTHAQFLAPFLPLAPALSVGLLSAHCLPPVPLLDVWQVFGCKQNGPAAVEADNVFVHLTYEGAVDISKVSHGMRNGEEGGSCGSIRKHWLYTVQLRIAWTACSLLPGYQVTCYANNSSD